MAILSTINVKETRILFQEFMRLTSNCFLHLAFDYCALRVIQVQAHHQTSFHLSCINNFFYGSQVCHGLLDHCMFLNVFFFTSHLWGNQVQSFLFHRLGIEAQKGKTTCWTIVSMAEQGLQKPNPSFISEIHFCCTEIQDRSTITCFQELRQRTNYNKTSSENLRIYVSVGF